MHQANHFGFQPEKMKALAPKVISAHSKPLTEGANVWLKINDLPQHFQQTYDNYARLYQDALMGKEQLVLLTTLSPGRRVAACVWDG